MVGVQISGWVVLLFFGFFPLKFFLQLCIVAEEGFVWGIPGTMQKRPTNSAPRDGVKVQSEASPFVKIQLASPFVLCFPPEVKHSPWKVTFPKGK